MGIADIIAIIVIIALLVCAVRYWVLRKKGCGCGGCGGCGSCGGCNGCGVGSGVESVADGGVGGVADGGVGGVADGGVDGVADGWG